MNLLVTLDQNYLAPLRIMLGSLFLNNPAEQFEIYLIADGLTDEDLACLHRLCAQNRASLHRIEVSDAWFANAPVIRYYSRAMYYRLLAPRLLPDTLDRVLYLDPDILVIGEVRPLYETALPDQLYAAAMHYGLTGVSGPVGKLRLPNAETDMYFNSGVLLMNLPRLRRETSPAEVFAYAEKYRRALILPDQDILNSLYGERILAVDESIWNYDARKYETYRLSSQGKMNMDWVMAHTVFLHFCGKNKPWAPSYHGRFSALYKHYQHLLARREMYLED